MASGLEAAYGFVRDELLQRGASLFQPLANPAAVDLAVRVERGQYVEVQVLSAGGEAPRRFRVERLRPHLSLFIVCVAFDGDTPSGAWVLPSATFDRFADGLSRGASRELDLDAPDDEPLSERLSVYQDRWPLITEYSKYRSVLADPTALQVRLALG